jgi:glycosyltransferase involved in cell wall biosynthesis
MKIINICSSFGIGGREMIVPSISKGLIKKGHDVLIIANSFSWLEKNCKEQKLNVTSFKIGRYIHIPSIIKLAKIIKEFSPDIIHMYFITDIWLVVPVIKLFYPKCKICLTRSMNSAPMKGFIHTLLFNAIDKVLAVSLFVKKDFIYKTHINSKKVDIVYLGVDIKNYEVYHGNTEFRNEYKISRDTKLIGLVGRIDKAKGQDLLIESAKIITQKFKNVKFAIIGSNEKGSQLEYENYLKNLVTQYNLEEYFIFTGFRSDIAPIMNNLDIFVCPSKEESFGLVVPEAMASKKAVVVVNRGALPEIVVDKSTGLIVEYSYKSLAEGILYLLENPDLITKFGINGYARTKELFDSNKTIENLLNVYQKLLL